MNYKQQMHIKLTMCMPAHTHGQGKDIDIIDKYRRYLEREGERQDQ